MELRVNLGELLTQYVIVDGVNYTPSSASYTVGNFDMGLHKITIKSGSSNIAKAYGFIFM
jgi:hypothetical protein